MLSWEEGILLLLGSALLSGLSARREAAPDSILEAAPTSLLLHSLLKLKQNLKLPLTIPLEG